jgi:hypothetical protein
MSQAFSKIKENDSFGGQGIGEVLKSFVLGVQLGFIKKKLLFNDGTLNFFHVPEYIGKEPKNLFSGEGQNRMLGWIGCKMPAKDIQLLNEIGKCLNR